jgi:hypothetical protein
VRRSARADLDLDRGDCARLRDRVRDELPSRRSRGSTVGVVVVRADPRVVYGQPMDHVRGRRRSRKIATRHPFPHPNV